MRRGLKEFRRVVLRPLSVEAFPDHKGTEGLRSGRYPRNSR